MELPKILEISKCLVSNFSLYFCLSTNLMTKCANPILEKKKCIKGFYVHNRGAKQEVFS